MQKFKSLKEKIRQCKIKNKIVLGYLCGILPILIVLIIGVIGSIFQMFLGNIRTTVNNNAQVIISQIELKIHNAENCANSMLGYLNEMDFLKSTYTAEHQPLTEHNQILKKVTYVTRVFNDIDGIVFLDVQGNIYGDNNEIEEVFSQKNMASMLECMQNRGGKALWFPMNETNSISKKEGELTLTMGKNIVDIESGEILGTLFITISELSISDVYSSLSISTHAYYCITDLEGLVVSSPYKEEIGINLTVDRDLSQHEPVKGYYSGGKFMYCRQFREHPLLLVFHAPITDFLEELLPLIFLIVLIGILCIASAIFLTGKLSKLISQPIVELADAMDEVVEGNMSVRYRLHTQDETRLLGQGFNNMLDTIEELFKNIRVEQQDKRKYELALIQSQVKPHFLYNTLDTIYVLAHMGRVEEAKITTKALAEFYRVSLSKGKELITVREEVKCTRDYLKIQGIRYADDFKYEIMIPESLMDYHIPKLSLQPLVENAIYHGLKEKEGQGLLRIGGKEQNEEFWLCVEDNGCGMADEKAKKILSEEKSGSFGIKNLDNRIKLYYGDRYGICIKSSPNAGTLVILHLPGQ
ncbi:cache domain-containing sensor histidine kinase [Eisenbergiella sp.]